MANSPSHSSRPPPARDPARVAHELEQARRGVDEAEAALRRMRRTVDTARAGLDRARRDLQEINQKMPRGADEADLSPQ